jgi:thiol:disulfide interchange protein
MSIISRRSFVVSFAFVSLLLIPIKTSADDNLTIDVVASKSAYAPGDTVILGLKVNIPGKYHLYGNPLGPGIGKPVNIGIDGAGDMVWLDIKKNAPVKFYPSTGDWVWAYKTNAYFFVKGIAGHASDSVVNGNLQFNGLMCSLSCIPVEKSIPFTLKISNVNSGESLFQNRQEFITALKNATQTMTVSTVQTQSKNVTGLINLSPLKEISMSQQVAEKELKWNYIPKEKKTGFNLWVALLLGFISGIILNFMPCVLPVLGIKIISFSQHQQGSKKSAVLHSLVFSAGIVSVFIALAALSSFANFSWGEQFQKPAFLVAIIALVFVFALSMFDVFTIILPGSASNLGKKGAKGFGGDLLNGMVATILATPCSGPLLGATLAWTMTQVPIVVFTVFSSIGLGMAFPYVLFSSSRTLSRLMPRPGKWMSDFKFLMGFVLMGAAVYLMLGLPHEMIISTLGVCLFLAFSVILYVRYSPFGSSFLRKAIVGVIAVLISASGLYFNFGILYKRISQAAQTGTESGTWKQFSPQMLKSAHAEGRNIIVDFTANWCMNCQYNTIAVLRTGEIDNLIKNKNILAMTADLTHPDPAIEALLHNLGSKSIPFLAVFPKDNPYQPIVMRDLLSKRELEKVLNSLK